MKQSKRLPKPWTESLMRAWIKDNLIIISLPEYMLDGKFMEIPPGASCRTPPSFLKDLFDQALRLQGLVLVSESGRRIPVRFKGAYPHEARPDVRYLWCFRWSELGPDAPSMTDEDRAFLEALVTTKDGRPAREEDLAIWIFDGDDGYEPCCPDSATSAMVPQWGAFERASAPRSQKPVRLPLEDEEWLVVPVTSRELYEEYNLDGLWSYSCSHIILHELNGVELAFGECGYYDIRSIQAAMRGEGKPQYIGQGPYMGTVMPAEGDWV